jgi:hypothetical protein
MGEVQQQGSRACCAIGQCMAAPRQPPALSAMLVTCLQCPLVTPKHPTPVVL